jgi:hypothetical protein
MGHPALIAGRENRRSLGFLPDFLSSLVVSTDLMRLSLLTAAYVDVDECCVVGNPEFARDDKFCCSKKGLPWWEALLACNRIAVIG